MNKIHVCKYACVLFTGQPLVLFFVLHLWGGVSQDPFAIHCCIYQDGCLPSFWEFSCLHFPSCHWSTAIFDMDSLPSFKRILENFNPHTCIAYTLHIEPSLQSCAYSYASSTMLYYYALSYVLKLENVQGFDIKNYKMPLFSFYGCFGDWGSLRFHMIFLSGFLPFMNSPLT